MSSGTKKHPKGACPRAPGPQGRPWASWWAGGAAGLLIVCVVGCLEGFLAERLTWNFRGFKGGKGPSLGGEASSWPR